MLCFLLCLPIVSFSEVLWLVIVMRYIHFFWLYLFTRESDISRTECFSYRQAVSPSECNRVDFPPLRRFLIGLNQGYRTCHVISILLGYMTVSKHTGTTTTWRANCKPHITEFCNFKTFWVPGTVFCCFTSIIAAYKRPTMYDYGMDWHYF